MRRSFRLAVLGSLVWCRCVIGFDVDKLTGGNGTTSGGGGETNIAPSEYRWSKNSSSAATPTALPLMAATMVLWRRAGQSRRYGRDWRVLVELDCERGAASS